MRYLAKEILDQEVDYLEPAAYPWGGIYHPAAPACFATVEDYLVWYEAYALTSRHLHSPAGPAETGPSSTAGKRTAGFTGSSFVHAVSKTSTVGLIFTRSNWVNGNLSTEDLLIRLLEKKGFRVVPVFCYSLKDSELGTRGSGKVVREYFFDQEGCHRINALIKLLTFFLETRTGNEDGPHPA